MRKTNVSRTLCTPCTCLLRVPALVGPGDAPLCDLSLPVEREHKDVGGGDGTHKVQKRTLPSVAVRLQGEVAVLGRVADGVVALAGHDDRQKGGGVEEHGLKKEEDKVRS